jgi:hypothetical protein
MSDIEGKVARVSDERVGKRTSFKFSQPVNRIHPANCLDSVDRITTQERPDIVWRIAIWRSQLAHAPRADWRAAFTVGAATESGSRRFFLRHRFLGDDDFWEQHDPGWSRSSSVLT